MACFVARPPRVVATAPRGIRRVGMPALFPDDRRGGTVKRPRHGAQTPALLSHHQDRCQFFGRQLFEDLGHHNT